jgi:tetratricopeptide (TPR) repeat protein
LARFAIVVSLALGAATPALAQRSTPAPTPAPATPAREGEGAAPENLDAARAARQHFERGLAHFQARAFREAIQEFELAAALVPSADLWFNIARAHEELNDYGLAAEHYRRYLRDRVDPPDREQVERLIRSLDERAVAAREAARHAPTTGTIRVQSDVDGAAIELDAAEVGETPLVLPVSMTPGDHRVDLTREGYVPFRSSVQVRAGSTTTAYATMTPETRYRALRGKKRWTWVLVGLAGASLATSLGFGGRAIRLKNDGDFDGARQAGTRSDYLMGAGLALGITATIVFFIEGRSVGTERVTMTP